MGRLTELAAAVVMNDREQLMLRLFQSIDDESQDFILHAAKSCAEAFPRHKRPVLKLIHGGPRAVPIRKRRADRAPAP